MVAKSPEFEKAITDSGSLPKTLSNDELLEVRPVES
jgi:acyl-CoA-binding protein